jgi:hypothetical protein
MSSVRILQSKIQDASKRDLQLYSKCYCVAVLQKRLQLKAFNTLNDG